jgi:hypothetical protein
MSLHFLLSYSKLFPILCTAVKLLNYGYEVCNILE